MPILTWPHSLVTTAAEKGIREECEDSSEEACHRRHPSKLRVRQRLRYDHDRYYDAGGQIPEEDVGEIGAIGSESVKVADTKTILRKPETESRK